MPSSRSLLRRAQDGLGSRWSFIIALLSGVFVFVNLRPDLIFADTRPITGDIVVHNGLVGAVTRHLWDHGLFSGWSMQWSAGFPLYRFYISLPALLVALFDVVLPAAVALKLVTALSLVAVPIACWALARWMGLAPLTQALFAVASLVALFDSSQNNAGGNIGSTVLGEFPYEWGMVCALLAIGLFASGVRGPRRWAIAGLLLAVTALCHPIAAIVVSVGLVCQVAVRPRSEWRAAAVSVAASGLVAALVAAYWYIPFVWYGNAAISGDFTKRVNYRTFLFPYSWWIELVIAVLVVAAVVGAIARRERTTLGLVLTTLACLLIVVFIPQGPLYNMRFAPYWNLFRLLLAAVGVSTLAQLLAPLRSRVGELAVGVVTLLSITFVIAWNQATLPFEHRTISSQGDWNLTYSSKWIVGPERRLTVSQQWQAVTFAGMERGPNYGEWEELIRTLRSTSSTEGCGRLAYEFSPGGWYGSRYDMQLIPSETDGCVSVVNGLVTGSPVSNLQFVAETSWSIQGERYIGGLPYEAGPDLDVAVRYLRELGADYFVAYSPDIVSVASKTEGLSVIRSFGRWTLYRVEGTQLVEPLAAQPIVDSSIDAKKPWADASMQWFIAARPELRRFSPDGPSSWQRDSWKNAEAPLLDGAAGDASVKVTDVQLGEDSVRFHIDKVGVPVMVRVSWYPTWQVEGADGPWRVAPNWMVVVPTDNDVVLRSEAGGMETFSSVLTVIGLLSIVGLAAWPVVRRRRTEAAADDTASDAAVIQPQPPKAPVPSRATIKRRRR